MAVILNVVKDLLQRSPVLDSGDPSLRSGRRGYGMSVILNAVKDLPSTKTCVGLRRSFTAFRMTWIWDGRHPERSEGSPFNEDLCWTQEILHCVQDDVDMGCPI